MASYKRKHLHSIEQLDKEQRRIKKAYRAMEHNWSTDIFKPQVTGLNTLSALASIISRKKSKHTTDTNDARPKQGKTEGLISNLAHNETVQKLALNTGRSWLRWQAFNVGVYLLKKGWQSVQTYRKKRKLSKHLPSNKMQTGNTTK